MALALITRGLRFWSMMRPNYTADTLSEITDNLVLLADKFIQLPDRSIYYVTSSGEYFMAFDTVGRPVFLAAIISGTVSTAIRSVSETTTATTADHTILCNAGSSPLTVNLFDAVDYDGKILCIKKTDESGNIVTIEGFGTQLVDGELNQTLDAPMEAMTIQAFGGNWYILSIN